MIDISEAVCFGTRKAVLRRGSGARGGTLRRREDAVFATVEEVGSEKLT